MMSITFEWKSSGNNTMRWEIKQALLFWKDWRSVVEWTWRMEGGPRCNGPILHQPWTHMYWFHTLLLLANSIFSLTFLFCSFSRMVLMHCTWQPRRGTWSWSRSCWTGGPQWTLLPRSDDSGIQNSQREPEHDYVFVNEHSFLYHLVGGGAAGGGRGGGGDGALEQHNLCGGFEASISSTKGQIYIWSKSPSVC